ncbi:MAG TPA: potassium transporter TrkG [Clostridia bacterium]|nr:potassium transporter TrkG [Clostridia bacterium]
MFIGACAGSTGGGVKVSRFIIMFKAIRRIAHKILHPQFVTIIKLDKGTVQEDVIRGTSIFMVTVFFIVAISILLVSFNGFDTETSATAVITSINNVSPGLSMVSLIGDFSQFSDFSKIVLFLNMLIGRLEVYPILLLLSTSIWRKNMI